MGIILSALNSKNCNTKQFYLIEGSLGAVSMKIMFTAKEVCFNLSKSDLFPSDPNSFSQERKRKRRKERGLDQPSSSCSPKANVFYKGGGPQATWSKNSTKRMKITGIFSTVWSKSCRFESNNTTWESLHVSTHEHIIHFVPCHS